MVLSACFLAFVIPFGATEVKGTPRGSYQPQANQARTQEIDGKTEPDLIPPEVAWENLFVTMTTVVGDAVDKARDAKIEALARHNLGMSIQDTRTVVEVAESTMTRVEELRSPLELEHQGTLHLKWTSAQRQQRLVDVQLAVLDGRDRLRRTLKPQAFATLNRYLRDKVIPGTKIGRRVEQ